MNNPNVGRHALEVPYKVARWDHRVAKSPPPQLSVVDLFAGAGGLSEGFRQAGYRILAGTDVDPDASATFAANFPDAQTICGDVRDEAIHRKIVEASKHADVLVGGPPCQAFSQVRNHSRLIDDPRNSLYREFVNVVKATLPTAFVMENVTGMDQMGVREQIVSDLTLEGEYRVVAQIVDSANFGVPQTRKRLIFIGVRRSVKCYPPTLHGTDAINSITLSRTTTVRGSRYDIIVQESVLNQNVYDALTDPANLAVVSAAQAISDLACLPVGNRSDEVDYKDIGPPESAFQRLMRDGSKALLKNVQVPRINADTAIRLDGIPMGGNHRDLPGELLERYITGQRWGQDNGTGKLSRMHFYAYRRLHPNIWAWTLNTKADSVYHYSFPRSLSVREFSRLQSFPDRFIFTTDSRRGPLSGRHDGGPAHSRYRQVGNAVPPLLAKAIANAISASFAAAFAHYSDRAA